MASTQYYAPELVRKIQAILEQDSTTVGPITQWGQVLELLQEAKIAYEVDEVNPTLLLVHPDNRSKLGVNAFNAHRVGAYIKRVGADPQELKKATAFELCPLEPKRSQQIEFNRVLVDRSSGMLAPLSGGERYLSVGCGHTGQFAKAAGASCPTPQSSIADASGCLNVQHLSKDDPKLHVMLTRGWSWTILPWQCEHTWPQLPDLAQRALNASNSVASQASELETASTIAEFAQLQGSNINWDQCVQAAAASMPPCASYINTVGTYVRLYGGGNGAPMIKYLDEFSKAFGENRRLGEEFLRAVTDAAFPSLTTRYPHVRTALLATNLVSPKVVDGVARLLAKADVERLRAKSSIPLLDKVEGMMAHAWEVAAKVMVSQAVSTCKTYPVLGRLHTRTILHITNKAKLGFEKLEFKSIEQIQQRFVEELMAAMPQGTTIPSPWAKPAAKSGGGGSTAASGQQPSSSSHAAPMVATPMVNTSQLSDPAWIAKEAGFVIGKPYYNKAPGSGKELYILDAIDSTGAVLRSHDDGLSTPRDIKVDLSILLKKWAMFAGELPTIIPADKVDERTMAASSHFDIERQKCIAFQALTDFETASSEKLKQLAFMLNPAELRARVHIPKGKLELAPATDFRCICSKAIPGAPVVQIGTSYCFSLTEPPRARNIKSDDWKDEVVFVPFWWVSTTSVAGDANLTPKKHVVKDAGVTFTVLVNNKAIKAHERLLIFKEKKDASSAGSSEPAKRRKAA